MMPTVGPEQKRLNALFCGTWRGEEKLYPSDWDPNGGASFGTWVVHASLDVHAGPDCGFEHLERVLRFEHRPRQVVEILLDMHMFYEFE